MVRELWRFSGPVLTLAGVAFGLWGTLMMSRVFHPFGTFEVMAEIARTLLLIVTGRSASAGRLLKDASLFGEGNAEKRYRTLGGVYLLVFSFLLQLLGTALIVIDIAIHPQP